ncbi:cytochrome c oxidase subunit 3 [Mucisphaera calidilacus]|uniref:Cytochrome c oxidase subunit 3 n=1 Tax=Mucisphaera calidilacus TaxID=2527982 RepID=A0A518C0D2_9BACT|nr:cytochrome c oxidase subunit 3 [Mucisphaera calidilacus]QDU72680.1 Cytochrome c oxidase subunit 3 [Mucisphaera calidilacus]
MTAVSTPHVPKKAGDFGMWLFLISLGMLFAASMLAYTIIRVNGMLEKTNYITGEPIPPAGPPWGSMTIPVGLWVSTAVILLSSFTIHRALTHIRLERQEAFCRAMWATLGLAVVFLLVQTPSLLALLGDHWDAIAQRQAVANGQMAAADTTSTNPLYGAVFVLILIHALHVIGGVVPLAIVTRDAHKRKYDHEHHAPVKHLAMYWHFLDAVWISMFAVLLVTA